MKFPFRSDQTGQGQLQTFFITSYGRTATYWLTAMMNVHLKVYCTHGPTLERFTDFANDPPPEHTAKVFREQEMYYRRSLKQAVDDMRELDSKALVYGNVHAFSAVRLDNKIREEQYPYPCVRVNLLRHPFTRLESYSRHCVKQSQDDPYMKEQLLQFVSNNASCQAMKKMAERKYRVDLNPLDEQMFLFALVMLGNDISDSKINCRQVCYERLVKDAEYFVWFFQHVTDHQLEVTEQLLEAFRKPQRKNTSVSHERVSVEVYRAWPEWKKYLLRYMLESSGEMVALYHSLDYDITPALR